MLLLAGLKWVLDTQVMRKMLSRHEAKLTMMKDDDKTEMLCQWFSTSQQEIASA